MGRTRRAGTGTRYDSRKRESFISSLERPEAFNPADREPWREARGTTHGIRDQLRDAASWYLRTHGEIPVAPDILDRVVHAEQFTTHALAHQVAADA